ncbi:MAG: YtxH domain-containing protein [Microscillaceae bacterium]|nr:YtxH domain-containing protein [Microscillaceae bacterium]
MSRLTSFFLGVITGAAAGSLIGILFAPNEGKHTRDRISFQVSRMQSKLRTLIAEKEILLNEAKSQGEEHVHFVEQQAKRIDQQINNLGVEIDRLKKATKQKPQEVKKS